MAVISEHKEYEGFPEWEYLMFKKDKHRLSPTLTINSVKEGEVEIECCDGDNKSIYFFFDQESLKKLITHLQKQIK
jgi:hypothetical protein